MADEIARLKAVEAAQARRICCPNCHKDGLIYVEYEDSYICRLCKTDIYIYIGASFNATLQNR
jgi:ribosomal protein L37AE/L43A